MSVGETTLVLGYVGIGLLFVAINLTIACDASTRCGFWLAVLALVLLLLIWPCFVTGKAWNSLMQQLDEVDK